MPKKASSPGDGGEPATPSKGRKRPAPGALAADFPDFSSDDGADSDFCEVISKTPPPTSRAKKVARTSTGLSKGAGRGKGPNTHGLSASAAGSGGGAGAGETAAEAELDGLLPEQLGVASATRADGVALTSPSPLDLLQAQRNMLMNWGASWPLNGAAQYPPAAGGGTTAGWLHQMYGAGTPNPLAHQQGVQDVAQPGAPTPSQSGGYPAHPQLQAQHMGYPGYSHPFAVPPQTWARPAAPPPMPAQQHPAAASAKKPRKASSRKSKTVKASTPEDHPPEAAAPAPSPQVNGHPPQIPGQGVSAAQWQGWQLQQMQRQQMQELMRAQVQLQQQLLARNQQAAFQQHLQLQWPFLAQGQAQGGDQSRGWPEVQPVQAGGGAEPLPSPSLSPGGGRGRRRRHANGEVKEEEEDLAVKPHEVPVVEQLKQEGFLEHECIRAVRECALDWDDDMATRLHLARNIALDHHQLAQERHQEDMARLASEQQRAENSERQEQEDKALLVEGDIIRYGRFQDSALLDPAKGCAVLRGLIADMHQGRMGTSQALGEFRQAAVRLLLLEARALVWYKNIKQEVKEYFWRRAQHIQTSAGDLASPESGAIDCQATGLDVKLSRLSEVLCKETDTLQDELYRLPDAGVSAIAVFFQGSQNSLEEDGIALAEPPPSTSQPAQPVIIDVED